MSDLLEILKYTLPAFIVLLATYLTLRTFLKSEYNRLHLKLRMENSKDTIFLRLQAYERLTLLLERMRFSSIVPKMAQQQQSVAQLKSMLITSVQTEFDHNLSQQVYVSPEAWSAVNFAKDEMIKTIAVYSQSLPPDTLSFELSKKLLEHQADPELPDAISKALNILKTDTRQIYS